MGAGKSKSKKQIPQKIVKPSLKEPLQPQKPQQVEKKTLDIACDIHPNEKITHLRLGIHKGRNIFCKQCLLALGTQTEGIYSIAEFLEKSAQKSQENKQNAHYKKKKSVELTKLDLQGTQNQLEAENKCNAQKEKAKKHAQVILTKAKEIYYENEQEILAFFEKKEMRQRNNLQSIIDSVIRLFPTEDDLKNNFISKDNFLETLKAEKDFKKIETIFIERNKDLLYLDSNPKDKISTEKRKSKLESIKKVFEIFQKELQVTIEDDKWKFIEELFLSYVPSRIKSDLEIKAKAMDQSFKYKSQVLLPEHFETVHLLGDIKTMIISSLLFTATQESKLNDFIKVCTSKSAYLIVMQAENGSVLGLKLHHSELGQPDETIDDRVNIFSLTNNVSYFIERPEVPKFKSIQMEKKFMKDMWNDPNFKLKYSVNEDEMNIGDGQFILKKNLLTDLHKIEENGNLKIEAAKLSGEKEFKIVALEAYALDYP